MRKDKENNKKSLFDKNSVSYKVMFYHVIVSLVTFAVFSQIEKLQGKLSIRMIATLIVLFISFFIYFRIIKNYFKPLKELLYATNELVKGNFSIQLNVKNEDEIGTISMTYNQIAKNMESLVGHLESIVNKRTIELASSNRLLNENKEQLHLILNSIAEGLFRLDKNGICTFCNTSALKLLGYEYKEELLGQKIHDLIHHSYGDGRTMPLEECNIMLSALEGIETFSSDDVFWRKDGSSINVIYHSFPQIKNGELIGAVVTFMDNTEQKKYEEHIKYLSFHDSLTGLYNRSYLKNILLEIDKKENLPISIIYADINGLKLTNDIYGHHIGDELLCRAAKNLKNITSPNDILARVGGDEFVIILPKTDKEYGNKIMQEIKEGISKEYIEAIQCTMSMGLDTKTSDNQDIDIIIENAENIMYREKTVMRKRMNANLIQSMIDTLHRRNVYEKRHAENVALLSETVAKAMNLTEPEIKRVREASYYHDIGKIVLREELLTKRGLLNPEEKKEMQQHSIIGFRILNLFEETMDLADVVFYHHENWDGSGYPKGLKGEEIPKTARLIRVSEKYETLLLRNYSKEDALREIRKGSGTKYDPKVVDAFFKAMGDNQGVELVNR